MKRINHGFSSVEAVLIIVVVLALAGVGFWVAGRQSNDSDGPMLSGADSVDAPTAPEVKSIDDLAAVEETLDKLNPEAGNADNDELDDQAKDL